MKLIYLAVVIYIYSISSSAADCEVENKIWKSTHNLEEDVNLLVFLVKEQSVQITIRFKGMNHDSYKDSIYLYPSYVKIEKVREGEIQTEKHIEVDITTGWNYLTIKKYNEGYAIANERTLLNIVESLFIDEIVVTDGFVASCHSGFPSWQVNVNTSATIPLVDVTMKKGKACCYTLKLFTQNYFSPTLTIGSLTVSIGNLNPSNQEIQLCLRPHQEGFIAQIKDHNGINLGAMHQTSYPRIIIMGSSKGSYLVQQVIQPTFVTKPDNGSDEDEDEDDEDDDDDDHDTGSHDDGISTTGKFILGLLITVAVIAVGFMLTVFIMQSRFPSTWTGLTDKMTCLLTISSKCPCINVKQSTPSELTRVRPKTIVMNDFEATIFGDESKQSGPQVLRDYPPPPPYPGPSSAVQVTVHKPPEEHSEAAEPFILLKKEDTSSS